MTFDNPVARSGVYLTQHEATGAHVAIEYPQGTRMGGRVAFFHVCRCDHGHLITTTDALRA